MEIALYILITICLFANLKFFFYKQWKKYSDKHKNEFNAFTPKKDIDKNNAAIKKWRLFSLLNSFLLLFPLAMYLKQFVISFLITFSVTFGFGLIISILKFIGSKYNKRLFVSTKNEKLNSIIMYSIWGFSVITILLVLLDKEIQQIILNFLMEKENGTN